MEPTLTTTKPKRIAIGTCSICQQEVTANRDTAACACENSSTQFSPKAGEDPAATSVMFPRSWNLTHRAFTQVGK